MSPGSCSESGPRLINVVPGVWLRRLAHNAVAGAATLIHLQPMGADGRSAANARLSHSGSSSTFLRRLTRGGSEILVWPERRASVMIEKFAGAGSKVGSEFLDLNHTSKSTILVSLVIAKFAPQPSLECRRTSRLGH